ncbi:Axin interactor dorsalization-associated protein, C-terminal domain [Phytophthora cactorum]|nr:Axin interactor dorsalization-associated protein, C-terminal domain [Phytophthora cactorum]
MAGVLWSHCKRATLRHRIQYSMRLAVRDVTAILQVRVHVDSSQFDSSLMTQPEFLLATRVVFRSVRHGGTQLQASWRVFRSFHEFQGLDAQLRHAFPQDMKLLAPPPPHRRRTWLRRHRSAKFLAKRCAELNDYLERLLSSPHLRLTRFLDPRAPLVLRCFCNFDRRPSRMQERRSDDAKLDELQANLMDDKSRNMAMCTKYECACRVSPFRQFNDLDKRLYDALTGFPAKGTTENDKSEREATDALANDHLQLSVGVELLRQTLANYGLLHVHTLERHFRTSAVDLKKRLHEFKSRRQLRVGAVELVLLATMLDLSIFLITNDHEGSEQNILPLAGLRSIRKGGRVSMTFGYILPTLVCVNGFYLLAERERIVPGIMPDLESEEEMTMTERQRRRMWQGVDEMDRRFMAEIERTLSSGADAFALAFDFDMADSLNSASWMQSGTIASTTPTCSTSSSDRLVSSARDVRQHASLCSIWRWRSDSKVPATSWTFCFMFYLKKNFASSYYMPGGCACTVNLQSAYRREADRLAGRITNALPACQRLTEAQKGILEKVIVAMEMRAKCLSSVDGQRKPTKEDMEDVLEAELVNATTQAAVLRSPGATYLDIRITKIGLKDASVYVNPTMAVSVFDYSGKAMEETRETGVGACSEPQYVSFNAIIQLATNLRKMEDHGAAITFEFFHYKAKKRKKSCRCWALLEMDEIKDGPVVLELYQKPMDPKRKRIHLFTEKELYLQLELRLQKL